MSLDTNNIVVEHELKMKSAAYLIIHCFIPFKLVKIMKGMTINSINNYACTGICPH